MAHRQEERPIPEGVAQEEDDALVRRLRNLPFPAPPAGARERTWERIEALLRDAGNGCGVARDSER
jgi:hypothetical protein